jgi:hypothetical protein
MASRQQRPTSKNIAEWLPADVELWALEKGLDREDAAKLAAQKISGKLLTRMTEAHFLQIGIPLGPAMILMEALQELDPGTFGKLTSRAHSDWMDDVLTYNHCLYVFQFFLLKLQNSHQIFENLKFRFFFLIVVDL